MDAFKIETMVNNDGTICLPSNLKSLANHKVEVLVLDKGKTLHKNGKATIPAYRCGGKKKDFTREELYGSGA